MEQYAYDHFMPFTEHLGHSAPKFIAHAEEGSDGPRASIADAAPVYAGHPQRPAIPLSFPRDGKPKMGSHGFFGPNWR